jgi:intergrase/recombinase
MVIGEFNSRMMQMSDKSDKHMIEELKEAIQKKDPEQPVEKTLAFFCERTGISMKTCRVYYEKLISKGEIKEK